MSETMFAVYVYLAQCAYHRIGINQDAKIAGAGFPDKYPQLRLTSRL